MTKIKQIVGLQSELDGKVNLKSEMTTGYLPITDINGTGIEEGYPVETDIEVPTKSGASIPTTEAVQEYIDKILAAIPSLKPPVVLNLTQTAGDTEVATTHEPGDLLVIGTPGYYGTSGASSDELLRGWWIVCKVATTGDAGAWVPANWDVIEMDYSTGLQDQLTGRRNVIEPVIAANTPVAINSAYPYVPFDVQSVLCFVNGIAINYNAAENINSLPVNCFGISGQNLWIHLPYDLNAEASDDDLVTLVYFSI